VKDDPIGLSMTLQSLIHAAPKIEIIVVDGSSTSECYEVVTTTISNLEYSYLAQDPAGVYEAMNFGLTKCIGEYVMFLNAGDALLPFVDLTRLEAEFHESSNCLLFQSIEHYKNLWFLRPKSASKNFENGISHQAILFPKRFYATSWYDTSLRVSADGKYIAQALANCSFQIVEEPLALFELGGISSNYTSFGIICARVKESERLLTKFKLFVKFLLWHTLGTKNFYRLLGFRKYGKVSPTQVLVCVKVLTKSNR
jgi:glycosyltransferase involved in cell wall biosynthesis